MKVTVLTLEHVRFCTGGTMRIVSYAESQARFAELFQQRR